MYWQGSNPSSGQQPSNRNSPSLHSTSNNNFSVQPNVADGNNSMMNISPQQNQAALPLPTPTQPPQPAKELHAAALCRYGQETVQEIVARTQEIFQTLRATQPPDGKSAPGSDRKPKVQDTIRNIRSLFKRLRVIYEKIEESCPTTENIDVELEKIIPFKDDVNTIDEKKNTDAYIAASEEYRELMEQVMLRNRHLRETMDQLRLIIWDVNTMLAMRKE